MIIFSLMHDKTFSGTAEEIVVEMKRDHPFTYNQSNAEYIENIYSNLKSIDKRSKKNPNFSLEEDFIDLLFSVDLIVHSNLKEKP